MASDRADSGVDDLGDPIEELRDYEVEAPDGFVEHLRHALQRRSLGSQVATLGWAGLGTVAIEFFRMLFSFFDAGGRDSGGSG